MPRYRSPPGSDEEGSSNGSDNESENSGSGSDGENGSDDENVAFDMCDMLGVSPAGNQQAGSSHDFEEDDDDNEEEGSGEDDGDSDGSKSSNISDSDDDNAVSRLAIQPKKGEKKGGRGYLWPVGKTLRVRFLDGQSKYHSQIMTIARTWEKYANIHFKVVTSGPAEIRISLSNKGWNSFVGTAALSIDPSKHTMNLAVTSKTSQAMLQSHVLHEFGHALGCIHEHSSPGAKIPWIRSKVLKKYSGPPNNWTTKMIESNVLEAIPATLYTTFDRHSIMLYAIDPKLIRGTLHTERNYTLSATDKSYIAKMYPKKSSNVRRRG